MKESKLDDEHIEISSLMKLLLITYCCVSKKLRKKFKKHRKIMKKKYDLASIMKDH